MEMSIHSYIALSVPVAVLVALTIVALWNLHLDAKYAKEKYLRKIKKRKSHS